MFQLISSLRAAVIVMFILDGSNALLAQLPPVIDWQNSFGGSGQDQALSIMGTTDGGSIVGGWTSSSNGDVTNTNGNDDYWMVKLDEQGSLQWQRTFGGGSYDICRDIKQTSDGGYVLAGNASSSNGQVTGNHGGADMWIVKTDALGDILWQRAFGGSGAETGCAIRETTDHGYVAIGQSSSTNGDITDPLGGTDVWVVKLDSSGVLEWERSLGGSEDDYGNGVVQTQDGGYAIAATTYSTDGDITASHGAPDGWVVKLTATGELQWQRPLGGSSNDDISGIDLAQDGGYVVVGSTLSQNMDVQGAHGSLDMWVVKLSDSGEIEWQHPFGGSGSDYGAAIKAMSDGSYVSVGSLGSTDGAVILDHATPEVWVVKMDATGQETWQAAFGGDNGTDNGFACGETIGGDILVAGASSSQEGDLTTNHGLIDYWAFKLEGTPLALNSHQLPERSVVYDPLQRGVVLPKNWTVS